MRPRERKRARKMTPVEVQGGDGLLRPIDSTVSVIKSHKLHCIMELVNIVNNLAPA